MEKKESRKVWDNCFSCGIKLQVSTQQHDWRECQRCRLFSRSLFLIFGLAIVALWVVAYKFTGFQSTAKNVSTLGLSLDVIGAWLLATGYVEIMVRMATGWGGGGEEMNVFSEKNFKKRIGGLVFLGTGFFLQGLGTILS